MTRHIYRLLLQLHPAEFRYRYAGEMLWIFDATATPESRAELIADSLCSCARQWVFRSSLWKYVLGFAINAMLVVFTVVGQQRFGPAHRDAACVAHGTAAQSLTAVCTAPHGVRRTSVPVP